MIETKDLLNWYFTVGALVFGVFGFLYSVYASAMFQATKEKPMPAPITVFLICQSDKEAGDGNACAPVYQDDRSPQKSRSV